MFMWSFGLVGTETELVSASLDLLKGLEHFVKCGK